jgi:integrase
MARGPKPSVRYWKSWGGYGAWINGTQHLLAKGSEDAPTGPTYLEALGQFRKLLALETDKGTDDYLVSSLLNQYRAHLNASRKSSAPGVFEVLARGFAEEFGPLRVCELKPHAVEAWLDRQDRWNPTSKAHAGTLILAAVSWARRKGFIETDPLAGRVDLPQPLLRGREARMSDELLDLMIAEADANKMRSKEWGLFLRLLRHTGARPGELRAAEAFNYVNGKLIFRWNATKGYVWKNAKKSRRDRVIYIPPALREYVERQVREYPSGPIFRTPRGAAWSATSIGNKWQWLLKRPNVVAYCKAHGIELRELRPYNLRHTFISNYLDATGDYYGCAQICGTSIKMLETRYSHPDVDRIQERYLAFIGSTGGATGTPTGSTGIR